MWAKIHTFRRLPNLNLRNVGKKAWIPQIRDIFELMPKKKGPLSMKLKNVPFKNFQHIKMLRK
jgi:hypothetical protein